jgi:hypothetical protein
VFEEAVFEEAGEQWPEKQVRRSRDAVWLMAEGVTDK